MKNEVLLTVILPVYNAERYIEQAIESILNQTFKDFKLIIIDDCSTDNSFKLIKKFSDKRITLLKNEINKGKVDTVNSVLESVTSKYFTVHDADDISYLDRFEKQIDFLENSDCVMCGTSFETIDDGGHILETNKMPTEIDKIRKNIDKTSQFHGPTMIIKTDIIKNIGGFYRDIKYGEDIDFSMRVIEKYDALNISEVLYKYRANPYSITKSCRRDIFKEKRDKNLRNKLREQRITRDDGLDAFMRNDTFEINTIEQQANNLTLVNLEKYVDDQVSYLLYYKLKRTALCFAIRYWIKYPKKYKILKTIAYVLRVITLGDNIND